MSSSGKKAGGAGTSKTSKAASRGVKRYVPKPAASESPVKSHIAPAPPGPHMQGTNSTSAIAQTAV